MKKKILILTVTTLFIDRLLKCLVINNIIYDKTIYLINKLLYLTYVKNTGGAWSIFSNNTILLIIIGIFSLILIYWYLKNKVNITKLESIYFSLLLSGIISNLIDRIIYKGVIDYIGIIIFGYYFPIFNFSDMCIVLGGILLIIDSMRGDINARSRRG